MKFQWDIIEVIVIHYNIIAEVEDFFSYHAFLHGSELKFLDVLFELLIF